jgi:hypothetical protein
MTIKLSTKKLIISLIKDDLIHTKLIHGLEALGLSALNYHLHLSETVFEIMRFPQDESSEPDLEYYLGELKKANRFNMNGSHKAFDTLALSIYTELERRKSNAK